MIAVLNPNFQTDSYPPAAEFASFLVHSKQVLALLYILVYMYTSAERIPYPQINWHLDPNDASGSLNLNPSMNMQPHAQ